MSDSNEPKLTPEAVKMLNDLAASGSNAPNLSPEAKANLEKLSNFHLTHTYQAHKNSYLIMALVLLGLAGGAVLFGLDSILRDPPVDIVEATALAIMALFPLGFALGARHFLILYGKL